MVKRWILAAAVIWGVLLPATSFARVWRDQNGKVINADFVKVEGGMIYLKPENKYAAGTPFPFYDFSEADQEFVKGILKKKGQEDRIPPAPPKKDNPNGNPAQPIVGGIPVTVVPNPMPAIPTGIPNAGPANTGTSPAIPIAVTPTVPPAYTPPSSPGVGYTPPATPAAGYTPPAMPTPSPMPSSNLRLPMGPQFTESKQCLSCKKEIPMTSSVGQKCPHCGVLWTEEQNRFGQVTNSMPGSSSNGWTVSRGMIRLAFLIGAFVIGGIAKIVHDNR